MHSDDAHWENAQAGPRRQPVSGTNPRPARQSEPGLWQVQSSGTSREGAPPLGNLIQLTQQAVAVAEELRHLAADDPMPARELCYLARRLEIAAVGGDTGMVRLGEAAAKALDRFR